MVRQGTVNLKNKIIDLNYDVQQSGKKVASKVSKYSRSILFHFNYFVIEFTIFLMEFLFR